MMPPSVGHSRKHGAVDRSIDNGENTHMIKITFVYPDYESLAVEYLMSVCRQDGQEVDLVFYTTGDPYVGLKKREVFFKEVATRIANTKPQVAAFSCVTDNYQDQLGCAKALKEIAPGVLVVFGGVHPTAVPEMVLKEAAVDCIAIGEAERSFSAFLGQCRFDKVVYLPEQPVAGIVFKVNGMLVGDLKEGELPDLNALPFPYKKPFHTHFKLFSRAYDIMSSRGCPYSCSYCFNSHMRLLRGKSLLRRRTVDNVIAELLHARNEHNFKYVIFNDDCFTASDAWLEEFCERYRKEVRRPFACLAIPQYLNQKKVDQLRAAGCYHVEIGVQSLDQGLCKSILQRNVDAHKIVECIAMLKKAGILVQVDHMIGYPDDVPKVEEAAALFYNEHRPHVVSVFWLTYYPKTAIIDIARNRGVLHDGDIEKINQGVPISNGAVHTGGSVKDPRPYYGLAMLMHWIPLLPKGFVRFLVRRKLYRKLSFNNTFMAVLVPRFFLAIFHRKNFMDRGVILRMIDKII
jgi:anaerobic magnesium-protoporphyrin IX monomethyl ester cyclase